nr:MAG TPA: hypothetical protein [Caudoviricetes sp.]
MHLSAHTAFHRRYIHILRLEAIDDQSLLKDLVSHASALTKIRRLYIYAPRS